MDQPQNKPWIVYVLKLIDEYVVIYHEELPPETWTDPVVLGELLKKAICHRYPLAAEESATKMAFSILRESTFKPTAIKYIDASNIGDYVIYVARFNDGYRVFGTNKGNNDLKSAAFQSKFFPCNTTDDWRTKQRDAWVYATSLQDQFANGRRCVLPAIVNVDMRQATKDNQNRIIYVVRFIDGYRVFGGGSPSPCFTCNENNWRTQYDAAWNYAKQLRDQSLNVTIVDIDVRAITSRSQLDIPIGFKEDYAKEMLSHLIPIYSVLR